MIKLIIAISLKIYWSLLLVRFPKVKYCTVYHTHTQFLEITYKTRPYIPSIPKPYIPSIPAFHEFCNSKKAHQLLYYHNNAAFQQAFHNTSHCTVFFWNIHNPCCDICMRGWLLKLWVYITITWVLHW